MHYCEKMSFHIDHIWMASHLYKSMWSHSNVINVERHFLKVVHWIHTKGFTQERIYSHVINVKRHFLIVWFLMWSISWIVWAKVFSHWSEVKKGTHTGEKWYSCDECDKSLYERGDLSEPKRIHTGEKPYYCDVCDKTFCEGGDLTKHKRIHRMHTMNLL